MLEVVLKCPLDFCHHVFNLRSAEGDMSSSAWSHTSGSAGACTHPGLAVLSKGVFDEHGSDGEAQGAVRVADTRLPAGRAALQHTRRRDRTAAAVPS